MGEKIAAIFALLFVLMLAGSMVFAVGAFLYAIFGDPIGAVFDGIKEKKKRKVLDESKMLKGLRELNSNFSYEAIKAEYSFGKECRSRQEYDRTPPRVYLHTVLNREKSLIRALENAVQKNNTVIAAYEKKCDDLLNKYRADPAVAQRFKKIELEMFEKEKLYIGTSYCFKITVSFRTPKARKYYTASESFSREKLLTEMKKVKEEAIARKERLAEMEHERARMTAKLRYEVLKRDNYRCVICGASSSDGVTQLHVDHIVPIAKGGKTELDNLQTLCQRCNLGKGTSD